MTRVTRDLPRGGTRRHFGIPPQTPAEQLQERIGADGYELKAWLLASLAIAALVGSIVFLTS